MQSLASLILIAFCLSPPAACFADQNAALEHDTAQALSQGIVNNNSQEFGVGMMGLGALAVLDAAEAPAPRPAGPSPAQLAAIRRQQMLYNQAQELNNKGVAFMHAGKYNLAIFDFQMALSKTPNDPVIAANLASATQRRAFEAQKQDALGDLKGGVAGAGAASGPDEGLKSGASTDGGLKDDTDQAGSRDQGAAASKPKPQPGAESTQNSTVASTGGGAGDLQLK